jgi:hypothetical protein
MLNHRRCAGAARSLTLWLATLGVCWIATGSARAYDLSRSYQSTADEVERGFVVGSIGLWNPEIGNWSDYHQLSLDFGAEFGIRFASIQSAHNLYFVGGLNVSPQMLDPDIARRGSDRATNVIFGYGGIRYMTGYLCFGDGVGCPFIELRLGLVFEANAAESGHAGPDGEFTIAPGIGYRFALGRVFQVGGRLDFSHSEESGVRGLGWLSLAGFAGIGW